MVELVATRDWSAVRNFLAGRRKALNISQDELSSRLGFSKNALAMWERGESTPSAHAWILWLHSLGLDLTLVSDRRPQPATQGTSRPKAS